jgi:2'-hydroxyisoflavone reductase
MTTRREFLKAGAVAGGALLAGAAGDLVRAASRKGKGTSPAKLDLLILGGTGFIGPHLVRLAVERGHKVTIFTRGRKNPELPDTVMRLQGDRKDNLTALEGKTWDAVVDDSATNPDWVRLSANLLQKSVGRYLFTSSTGVYYPYLSRGLDETTAPHLEVKDPNDGSETYGVSKARCEAIVTEVFGERGVVVRPGYIVGPGDTSDRFPYWPVRLARGGEILCPGQPEDPVQFIDVRDLAAFHLGLIEQARSGVYNATGPKSATPAPEFYQRARRALNRQATLTPVDDYEFLKAHQIEYAIPWSMLQGNDDGMMSILVGKAIDAGLRLRPVEETLRDTLAWWPSVPSERRDKPQFSITPDIEKQALADWHARHA